MPAFLTAGVEEDAITKRPTGSSVLTEPYLNPEVIQRAYGGQVPRVVELTYEDFNRGTTIDLNYDTQDYQRRYSPDVTCRDAEASVKAIYGADACRRGSRFYQLSTQAERALMTLNERGDPATSYPISLGPAGLRRATRVLRASTTKLVACVVESAGDDPLNVTVSPSSGYRVQGEKTFTLDPRQSRRVILAPEGGLGGAAIGDPGCTIDYDLASQAKNTGTPRLFIFIAGLLAALSGVLGYVARRRGWVKA